ncbi:hypothetical protein Aph01nite_81180 [Acrocarpospora phusangensis]|uniref:Uncharacterized protein n=1 Tax=Acrocarpospora phusangensis TaxID=1070424 RepID=A0A919UTI8_9ACTN|nr:hypothetical protein [Acrocarpospora phusangensis]GIH29808.1 hypothetical protein Aph01nite_81180 [Acrocarpospora phusangensis]
MRREEADREATRPEEVEVPRVYTSRQGAARIDSPVIRPSTLERLAREYLVDHTRNGRKVGWTEVQLAGAVAYLATKNQRRPAKPPSDSRKTDQAAMRRGDVAPLESKPGRRYRQTATA